MPVRQRAATCGNVCAQFFVGNSRLFAGGAREDERAFLGEIKVECLQVARDHAARAPCGREDVDDCARRGEVTEMHLTEA